MKRYKRGFFPWVWVLAFSAAFAGTAQSQRLNNRESNQERRMGGVQSGTETLKDEAPLDGQGPAPGVEGKEKQAPKSNREGNRMGQKMERERSAAPGALDNNSVPTDRNEIRK
ncbi:MAG: hypothetical protein HY282_02395 [Nitrospirae bacterium]|nr:hypothetical protein [Candidatus Manganitrophaceae bacterium]